MVQRYLTSYCFDMQKGFIALVSLLIISAVALSIAVSIVIIGVGEADVAFSTRQGNEATQIAQSCVEEALFRLRGNNGYVGGSLSVGNGSCTITVSGTTTKTITATATLSGPPSYQKQIVATAKQAGYSVVIQTWQEQ